MLVCRHPGLFFREHPAGRKILFLSFWDEKDSILIYLTWFSCSLQCARYHYEFTQSTISRITAPWNPVSTTFSSASVLVEWMMVQPFTAVVDRLQFQGNLNFFLVFLVSLLSFTFLIFLLRMKLALVTAVQF